MPFYSARDRKAKEIVPGGSIRTFWGEKTLLSYVDIEPGVDVPVHTHPQEQSGVVLEGRMEMGIEGEVKVLIPGDMYIIPGGVEHYARALDTKVKVLDVFSPVREDYKY